MQKYNLVNEHVLNNCIQFIQSIDTTQKPVMCVEIKQQKKKRSDAQNAYYWGVVIKTIKDFTGQDSEDLHEIFKTNFLQEGEVVVGSLSCKTYPTTKKLNTIEFNEFVEAICAFAGSELGLYIPMPGEYFNE